MTTEITLHLSDRDAMNAELNCFEKSLHLEPWASLRININGEKSISLINVTTENLRCLASDFQAAADKLEQHFEACKTASST